jgi:hypothetical protein
MNGLDAHGKRYLTTPLTAYARLWIGYVPCAVLPTDDGLVLAMPEVVDGVATATMADLERVCERHRLNRAAKLRSKRVRKAQR